MIRKKKLYVRPMKPFEAGRIKEENVLVKKYGLKNKLEVWKMLAKISYYRKRAMALAKSDQEEQEVFFKKLRNIGFKVNSISDALDLQIEDILERRLQSIVASKGLANTVKQARQMIAHKKIMIGGRVVNSPSYIVSTNEENVISIKEKKVKGEILEKIDKNVEEKDKELGKVPVVAAV